MIPSLPRPTWLRLSTVAYALAFFTFLFLPLLIVALFAFNNAAYPAPPWRGFTLDWFLGHAGTGRRGLFADRALLGSLWTSAVVAMWVTALAVLIGTANAFLIERTQFRGKTALSLLMLAPLVIPGVILGISILAFASRIANLAAALLGLEIEFLRPGLPLVVMGQLSFIISVATLTIMARLKRFDLTLEDAAYNLGATRAARLQPGRHTRRRVPDQPPALPAPGAARGGSHFVPDVLRELQHHADAGRLGFASDRDDVWPHARRSHTGAERRQPVPDVGLEPAGAGHAAPLCRHRHTSETQGTQALVRLGLTQTACPISGASSCTAW
ncbi:MAG: hypothetical protein NTY26_03105 [Burkholderiales bacterium]|nr:hypothetical protein [Burkholderiales bacterium]